MWFLFKILYVKGRNTCPCKGELYFILSGGVFTSLFLYTSLMAIFTYIVFIFDIYIYIYIYIYIMMMMYLFFTYLYICCFFSLFIHMFLLYAIFYFCFTLRFHDEFCLKCVRNTGCQSLLCHELSSCKIFQEFVLGQILLYSTSKYELSDL